MFLDYALLLAANFGPITDWLAEHPLAETGLVFLLLVLVSLAALVIARRYVLRLMKTIAARSKTEWDDLLLQEGAFDILVWAVPVFIMYQGLHLHIVPRMPFALSDFLERLALATLALIAVRVISALLSTVNTIYNRFPMARNRPIKGYVQVAQIVAYIFGGIIMIAILINQSPIYLITGLGAMTAIILLIFRDTLLSLVAGIQLTHNDLIRVGDWIEVPQFGADGDVIDIALHSVKVKNWDKTITVIPTHKFLDNSFKNWRGMSESGGRRIKRSMTLDMNTIRFLTEDEVDDLSRFVVLREYLAAKREDIARWNAAHGVDPSTPVNGRRLTNIGTFRAYIVHYLRQHPQVHQDMTFLIRQMEPTPEGVPIEVYVFTNDTDWIRYEGIQSDIFDHLLAIVPEFGLRVFQRPSGMDVAGLAGFSSAVQSAPSSK